MKTNFKINSQSVSKMIRADMVLMMQKNNYTFNLKIVRE